MRKSRFFMFLMVLTAGVLMFSLPAFAAARDNYPDIEGIYEGAPYADIARYDGKVVTIPEEYIFDREKLSGEVEMIIPPHWYFDEEEQRSKIAPESKVKVDNYIYIFRNGNRYIVMDMYKQYYKLSGVGGMDKESSQQRLINMLKNYLSADAASMYYFPNFEIVSINGVPWQETEWADFIISETKRRLKPGDELLNNDLLWDIYVNPKYSGRAHEVYKQKLANLESETSVDNEEDNNTEPGEQQNTNQNENITAGKAELKLGSKKVYVYGEGSFEKIVDLNVAPAAPQGYTLIPLRGVLDELGASLMYDGKKNEVVIETDKVTVRLTPGNKTAFVNDVKIAMEQPAVIENGRTLVPLRFVADQLGFNVEYDAKTKSITVKK